MTKPDDQSDEQSITRREFLSATATAGAVVVAVAAATSLVACDDDEDEDDEQAVTSVPTENEPVTLRVSTDQLVEAVDFEEHPLSGFMVETARIGLPYGTIVHQVNSNLVLALTPHDGGKSLIDIQLLDLNSSAFIPLLGKAAGGAFGHADAILYDARASESLLAWTECDIATMQWQVFVARITQDENGAYTLGSATLVDEGEPEYEVPLLAVVGDKAYWTVLPNPDGPARYEDSYLKAMVYGVRDPWVVHVSHGRMITTPLVSQGLLTYVPRVDTSSIYYQLTAIDVSDDKLVQGAVMPQSVRVLDAIYLDGFFCFSIENNYSHAGGLGLYGTYWQLPNAQWLHLYRKPSAPPVLFNGRLVVKSATRVIAIDAQGRNYCSIAPLTDSADYGDVLAGWGIQDRLVIYCNVRGTTAFSETQGVLRVFSAV